MRIYARYHLKGGTTVNCSLTEYYECPDWVNDREVKQQIGDLATDDAMKIMWVVYTVSKWTDMEEEEKKCFCELPWKVLKMVTSGSFNVTTQSTNIRKLYNEIHKYGDEGNDDKQVHAEVRSFVHACMEYLIINAIAFQSPNSTEEERVASMSLYDIAFGSRQMFRTDSNLVPFDVEASIRQRRLKQKFNPEKIAAATCDTMIRMLEPWRKEMGEMFYLFVRNVLNEFMKKKKINTLRIAIQGEGNSWDREFGSKTVSKHKVNEALYTFLFLLPPSNLFHCHVSPIFLNLQTNSF